MFYGCTVQKLRECIEELKRAAPKAPRNFFEEGMTNEERAQMVEIMRSVERLGQRIQDGAIIAPMVPFDPHAVRWTTRPPPTQTSARAE
jgi:hypothetical protein